MPERAQQQGAYKPAPTAPYGIDHYCILLRSIIESSHVRDGIELALAPHSREELNISP